MSRRPDADASRETSDLAATLRRIRARLAELWWPSSESRVRPTGFGLRFVIMALVVGLAAVNTGNNLLFLVFSMMLATLLVSGISSRASMRKLSIVRSSPTAIYATTPYVESIAVKNEKRLFPTVSVRAATETATEPAYLPYLGTRSSRTLMIESVHPKRGEVPRAPLELRSHYPFGFFMRYKRIRSPEKIVVYPKIERIVPFFPEREGGHGEYAAVFKGLGEDLYQIREYAPGESARIIDWKASSRVAKVMARDFLVNVNVRVTILVDASAVSKEQEDDLETQISLAASIVDYLHRELMSYQLVTTAGRLPFGAGPGHYSAAQRHLALLPYCPVERGLEFCRSQSSDAIGGSIPIFFSARTGSAGLPFKAYRVAPADRHVEGAQ
ncbi:MAG: DUF58 domain-containing protein [Acidobacteriota bacterium]